MISASEQPMNIYHCVARAQFGQRPFLNRSHNRDLWRRLVRVFPGGAACVLMPNHIHLLTEGNSLTLNRRLARVLSFWCKRHGYVGMDPLPKPVLIPDQFHLLRQIRYVHLNPCRASLCDDPLRWEWSTHRDWVGAVVTPWPDRMRWAHLWKWAESEVSARMHGYVSADPSVSVSGTPAPKVIKAPTIQRPIENVIHARIQISSNTEAWGNQYSDEFSLNNILKAVSLATRAPERSKLSLCAAHYLTPYSIRQLGQKLGLPKSSVYDWAQSQSVSLSAAWPVILMVLLDERLLNFSEPKRENL
jgi:hypothetical protein